MKRLIGAAVLLVALGAAFALFCLAQARRDPVERTASLALADWPAGAAPVRVALLADLHVGTLSTSPARLARVVAQVDAARPDLVLIAGDLLPGYRSIAPAEARRRLAPLAGLRAPLGVAAVPGNHDHWTLGDGLAAVLRPMGVTVLANTVVRRGPLALGGVDDMYTHHDRLPAVVAGFQQVPGARVVLTHSPDLAPSLPRGLDLLLAGHTHCGQVVLPWYGPLVAVWRNPRYRCGIVRDPTRTVVVTAGIGTSDAPFRFGAPSDWWLLTLGPRR